MMKIYSLLFFFLPFLTFSQTFGGDQERFPMFSECQNVDFDLEEGCFVNTLKSKVLQEFKVPDVVTQEGFQGELVILFEVNREGEFNIIYVDAPFPELKQEV